MQLNVFLIQQDLVASTIPSSRAIVTQLKKRAARKTIKVMYGETYDRHGLTLDSLKYYFTVSIIGHLLKEAGIDAEPTILIADVATCRNEPEVFHSELLEIGKERANKVKAISDLYSLNLNVILMSEYFHENQFQDQLKRIRSEAETRNDILEWVKQTVPEDKVDIEIEKGFAYAFEEIATIISYDLKVGPPREKFYDEPTRRIGAKLGYDKLMSVYLTPTYPLGFDYGFFHNNEEIEVFGVTAYKAGSKNLQDNRIVLRAAAEKTANNLINESFVGRTSGMPNPVFDLCVICEMARQRLESIVEPIGLYKTYFKDKSLKTDELRKIAKNNLRKFIFKPLKTIREDDHSDKKKKSPEEVSHEDFEFKLRQKHEIISYYENKRVEMAVDSVSDILPKLTNSGPFFHRGIVFAHKDFDKVLSTSRQGKELTIVSGLNPSGALHFGHKAMLDLLLWLQREFSAEVYIPITNDESYVIGKTKSLRESRNNAYELVIPSIIALGFDAKKTHIFVHSDYPDFFNVAMLLSRYTTYNNVRGLFGWRGSENPGLVFYMGALQMASIILPQLPEFGGPKLVLVPIGIDQHPYISLSRDIASKLNLIPPAELIWKFLMGLRGPENKMSSSVPNNTIFLTSTPDEAERLLKQAYTGSVPLASMHCELGGISDVCSVFSMLSYNFLTNEEWDHLKSEYESGKLMAGDLKTITINYVTQFLEDHKVKREKAKERIDDFLLRTPIRSVLETDVIPSLNGKGSIEKRRNVSE